MQRFSIALVSALMLTMSSQLTLSETVILDGEGKAWTVKELHLTSKAQCEQTFCDQFDTDCDGKLDEQCVGLEYDICEQGGIVSAYINAAFTGQCIEQKDCAPPGTIAVSPTVACEE